MRRTEGFPSAAGDLETHVGRVRQRSPVTFDPVTFDETGEATEIVEAISEGINAIAFAAAGERSGAERESIAAAIDGLVRALLLLRDARAHGRIVDDRERRVDDATLDDLRALASQVRSDPPALEMRSQAKASLASLMHAMARH